MYGGELTQTVPQGPTRGFGRLSGPTGADTSLPRYEEVVPAPTYYPNSVIFYLKLSYQLKWIRFDIFTTIM